MTLRLLPLGDSLTCGTFWSEQGADGPGPQGGYRAALEHLLLAAGNDFTFVGDQCRWSAGMRHPRHQGLGGWTLRHILEGHAAAGFAITVPVAELVARLRPDAVLLLAGANDVHEDLDAAAICARLAAVVRAIASAVPACRILVGTPLPRTVGPFGRGGCYQSTAAHVAVTAVLGPAVTALVATLAEEGLPVLLTPTALAVRDAERDLVDHLHPDLATLARLADQWYVCLVASGLAC